jgi:hypothetical protein
MDGYALISNKTRSKATTDWFLQKMYTQHKALTVTYTLVSRGLMLIAGNRETVADWEPQLLYCRHVPRRIQQLQNKKISIIIYRY